MAEGCWSQHSGIITLHHPFHFSTETLRASLVAQAVKSLPAVPTSLGWEDPLEEGMATHSIILAWKIPWIEEPGGLQSMGSQRVIYD